MSKGGGQTPAGDYLMSQLPQNVTRATGIANAPFQTYTGQLAPGEPGAMGQAVGAAGGVAQYSPERINAAQTPDMDFRVSPYIGEYMNPFIQNVIDTSMSDIDRSRQMATNANASRSTLNNAWGGDRLGVENAETNRAYGDIAARTAAGLRMGGYDTAMSNMMGDRDRVIQNAQFNTGLQQQAGLANQQAGLQGGNLNLSGAQTLGGLAGQQYGMARDPMQMAYQEFLRQINYPAQTQALLNAALGLVGPSMAGQYNEPQRPWSTVLPDMLVEGTNGFSMGLGSAMGGMGSDARLKTDIETAGYDAKGRRWVDFRYTWDEPGTVRRGVIAQEVQKTDPDAVFSHPTMGFLMVDYSKLN